MKIIKAIVSHPFRFKIYKDGLDIGIIWLIILILIF